MDQEGIRRKIKSLLALAESDNENEALTIPEEVEAVYEKLKIKKITYTDRKDHSSMDGEAFYYGKSTGKRAVDERWIPPQK